MEVSVTDIVKRFLTNCSSKESDVFEVFKRAGNVGYTTQFKTEEANLSIKLNGEFYGLVRTIIYFSLSNGKIQCIDFGGYIIKDKELKRLMLEVTLEGREK